MMRERFEDCEEGDCVDWNHRPSDADEIVGSQRSITDFEVDSGKIVVLPPIEWLFKKTNEDGIKVWKCVKKGRP